MTLPCKHFPQKSVAFFGSVQKAVRHCADGGGSHCIVIYGQYIHYFCGYSTEKHYLCSTIKRIYVYIEFDKDYLRELFEQGRTSDKKHRYQPEVIRDYYKCVMFLKRAENVEQLYRIHSLNYEVLQGDKKGVSSVRINIKYRLENLQSGRFSANR